MEKAKTKAGSEEQLKKTGRQKSLERYSPLMFTQKLKNQQDGGPWSRHKAW